VLVVFHVQPTHSVYILAWLSVYWYT